MAINEQHMEEPIFDMMLFDNIDDIIVDLPTDDEVLAMVDASSSAPRATGGPLPPPPPPPLLHSPAALLNNSAAAPAEDQLCDEDIAELEWLSNFFDDSSDPKLEFPTSAAAGAATLATSTAGAVAAVNEYFIKDDDSFFLSFSPVSVLDPNNSGGGGSSSSFSSSSSSSSSSGGDTSLTQLSPRDSTAAPVVPARGARSKRPRPAAFSPRVHVTIPFLPPSSEPAAALPAAPEAESFGESSAPVPKKKKTKRHGLSASTGGGDDGAAAAGEPSVRKCMHCEIQKTPQWRAGPMGPKTLCNACGVRYKSGRLFPEYRPAASPTFVPSLHSNSHKKVVEMRIKATTTKGGTPSPEKGGDLLEYIRRKD